MQTIALLLNLYYSTTNIALKHLLLCDCLLPYCYVLHSLILCNCLLLYCQVLYLLFVWDCYHTAMYSTYYYCVTVCYKTYIYCSYHYCVTVCYHTGMHCTYGHCVRNQRRKKTKCAPSPALTPFSASTINRRMSSENDDKTYSCCCQIARLMSGDIFISGPVYPLVKIRYTLLQNPRITTIHSDR